MADLQETATWETGIRQLEITDPVLGGPDGIDNIAPRQLANRTLYLKGQVDGVKSDLNQTKTNVTNLQTSKEDKSTVAALAARIAVVERKAAVFAAGGGMVLWQKPANQIPAGWQEVTNWRGRLPMGYDPGQTEFSTIGQAGGSKNTNISKSNLPNVGLSYKDSYYIERTNEGGIGGVIDTGSTNNYGPATSDRDNRYIYYRNAETDAMGSGEALPVLNPYRIVIFIEYVG